MQINVYYFHNVHIQNYIIPNDSHRSEPLKINCIAPIETTAGWFLLIGHGVSKAPTTSNGKPAQGGGITILEVPDILENGPGFRYAGEYKRYPSGEVTKIVVLNTESFAVSYGDGTISTSP